MKLTRHRRVVRLLSSTIPRIPDLVVQQRIFNMLSRIALMMPKHAVALKRFNYFANVGRPMAIKLLPRIRRVSGAVSNSRMEKAPFLSQNRALPAVLLEFSLSGYRLAVLASSVDSRDLPGLNVTQSRLSFFVRWRGLREASSTWNDEMGSFHPHLPCVPGGRRILYMSFIRPLDQASSSLLRAAYSSATKVGQECRIG